MQEFLNVYMTYLPKPYKKFLKMYNYILMKLHIFHPPNNRLIELCFTCCFFLLQKRPIVHMPILQKFPLSSIIVFSKICMRRFS